MNWDAMSERERDALVAEKVMGHDLDYEFAEVMGAPTVPGLRDRYDEWGILPSYTTDPAAARTVLAEVMRRNAQFPFIVALIAIAGIPAGQATERLWYTTEHALFALLIATPEQQCRAALCAVGVDV